MGTAFLVVRANLTVICFEEKMFIILPQIYPREFVDFFIRNYFPCLDDFHKWSIQFNIQDFYKIKNETDADLQFIFEELATNINFLDINLKTINSKLHSDVYREPTNYFSYLHSKSCHPPYMKNNITLSVARRIVRIVTDNKSNRLQELKDHLIEKIIDCSFIKLFQPSKFKIKPKMLLPSRELTILDFASTY